MFEKTGSVVGHVIGKEDGSVGGGGVGGVSKGGGWRLLPPIRDSTLVSWFILSYKRERGRRGETSLFYFLSLNNMSRIIFTVYAEEKKIKSLSFFVFPSTKGG
jgi:hypothetical protein